jgi:hypothetical protein
VDLYIHSHIRLHGVMLNYLSTEATLPLHVNRGRAIAHSVSRWLATAAARVRAQVRSSGIYDVQCGTGAGFLRVLWFPLPILIPPTAAH